MITARTGLLIVGTLAVLAGGAGAVAALGQAADSFAGTYSAIDTDAGGTITPTGQPGRYRIDIEAFNTNGCGGRIEAEGVAEGNVLRMSAENYDGSSCLMSFTRVGRRLRFDSVDYCAAQFSGASCGFHGTYRLDPSFGQPVSNPSPRRGRARRTR